MHKRRHLYIIILIFTAIIFLPDTSSASISMTLPQYVQEILLNNHTLRAAIKNVEAEYFSVLASVSGQRPNVDASLTGSYVTKQTSGNFSQSNVTVGNLGVRLTQRIDISKSFKLSEQQSILGYEASRANFDANVNTLIAAAEQTWWSAVLARENMKLQREIVLQRTENHRVTMEKYNQELVPRLDIVRSEAQVVDAETTAKNAETTYLNLLAELSLMAGGLDVEPVDEELQVPEFDITLNYDEALENRPDVRAAKITLERAKLVKKLTAKGLSPTLDFALQFTPWADPKTTATPNDEQLGASLTLTLPVTDGKGTKYRTINADRLIQAASANLNALEESTRRDITVAVNNWKNAAAAEQDKQRQVERSEEELRITELMYAEGMGAQIDLINAQTAYQAVRTEYLDAIRGMYVALVALRQAIGDYAPDEDGTWKEGVLRYAKGKHEVLGELGLMKLRRDVQTQPVILEPEPEEEPDEPAQEETHELSDEEIEQKYQSLLSGLKDSK